MTDPYLRKIFQALGIYDVEFHTKYNQYKLEKRYGKYLEMLRLEWFTRLIDLRRQLDIERKLKEKFPEPEYKINY